MSKKILLVTVLVGSHFLSGCASQAVSDDNLTQNTAFALGLDSNEFSISNRADSGIKTTYSVKTKSGKQYNCYVTGTISIVGKVVSDAICNEKGKPVKNPLLRG